MRVPSFMLGRDPGRGYFPPQRKKLMFCENYAIWCIFDYILRAYKNFAALTEGGVHSSLPPPSVWLLRH